MLASAFRKVGVKNAKQFRWGVPISDSSGAALLAREHGGNKELRADRYRLVSPRHLMYLINCIDGRTPVDEVQTATTRKLQSPTWIFRTRAIYDVGWQGVYVVE